MWKGGWSGRSSPCHIAVSYWWLLVCCLRWSIGCWFVRGVSVRTIDMVDASLVLCTLTILLWLLLVLQSNIYKVITILLGPKSLFHSFVYVCYWHDRKWGCCIPYTQLTDHDMCLHGKWDYDLTMVWFALHFGAVGLSNISFIYWLTGSYCITYSCIIASEEFSFGITGMMICII